MLGLLAFVWHLAALAPGVTWRDAGELSASAWSLGVAHPTGFPVWCLAGRLAAFLPLGDVGFRVNLVSAASLGLAVAGVATLLPLLARRRSWALGLAGLVALLGNPTLSLHARTTEVYAPTVALLVWLWVAVARGTPALAGALAGLLVGLHGASAAVPAVVGLALASRGSLRGGAVGVALATLVGLLVLSYLPLRAAAEPWRNWGEPDTWGRLVDHLTGARIRAAYADDMGALGRLGVTVPLALGQLWDQVGGLALLAPLGVLLTPARARGALVAAVVADLCYTVLLNPMGMRDVQTGTIAAAGVAVLGVVGAAALLLPFSRWLAPGLPLGVAGLLSLAAAPFGVHDARGGDMGHFALEDVPLGGVVLVGSDDLAATTTFVQGVEGARPDVVSLVKQHLADPLSWAAARRADGLQRLGETASLDALLAGNTSVELSDGSVDARLAGWSPGIPLTVAQGAPPLFQAFERALRRVGHDDDEGRRVVARWLSLAGTQTRGTLGDRALEVAWNVAHQAKVGVNEGARRVAAGEIGPARDVLREAVTLDPLSGGAWFNRGLTDALCQDLPSAREAFVASQQTRLGAPRAARALEALALAEANAGKLARALLLMEVAAPHLSRGRQAEATANLARLRAAVLQEHATQPGPAQ